MQVKIPIELYVYCTKKGLSKYYKLVSAEMNCRGKLIDISDLLNESDICTLIDSWCMDDEHKRKILEIEIEFDVNIEDGIIDNVELGSESIMDIVYNDMSISLLNQAKTDYFAECADQGININRLPQMM